MLLGQKDIKVISTEWFDIIYSRESERSAMHLAGHADSIYDELFSLYESETRIRMPVTLLSASDSFNAFFSNGYFNHIVLLDTTPPEDFSFFGDNILNVFRHELTHAVSINMSSKGWRAVQNILGDVINLSAFSGSGFLSEGASVSFESAGGEGRLNDPFYMHLIRQAKIQGEFPPYQDVSGKRDIFPAGEYYYYGGPFAEYLQKTYGMQRYADWWYACVSAVSRHSGRNKDERGFAGLHTYAGYFKKVYGISMQEAWDDFYKSIQVPQVSPSPLDDGACDFFDFISGERKKSFSLKNRKGALYENIAPYRTGFAYTDGKTDGVWLVRVDADGKPSRPKKLFSKSNVNKISLSADGRLMAVTYYRTDGPAPQSAVAVYDMRNRSWKKLDGRHIREAAVIQADSGYYLAAVSSLSQQQSLVVYRIETEPSNGAIKNFTEICGTPFPWGDTAMSLCDSGSGSLALIYKQGMRWSVREYSLDRAEGEMPAYREFLPPDGNMRIRNLAPVLAEDGGTRLLSFSWGIKETLPRFGMMDLQSGFFHLDSADISGGVYFPALIRGNIFYSGYFARDYKLLVRPLAGEIARAYEESARGPAHDEADTAWQAHTEEPEDDDHSAREPDYPGARPYKRIYNRRGVFLPVASGMIPLSQYDRNLQETSMISFPGASYLTHNPWNGDFLGVAAGYDPLSLTGGIAVQFSGGTYTSGFGTNLFSYTVMPQILLDDKGFKQATGKVSLTQQLGAGHHSRVYFTEQGTIFAGRQQTEKDAMGLQEFYGKMLGASEESPAQTLSMLPGIFGCTASRDAANYLTASGGAQVAFSTVHRTGSGVWEKSGITASLQYALMYSAEFGAMEDGYFAHIITPQVSLRVPRLIPVDCTDGRTYNMPLAVTASWTPSLSTLCSFSSEVMLYGVEIQHALRRLPWYFNRFIITAEYSGQIKRQASSARILGIAENISNLGAESYRDLLALNFLLTSSVNTGNFQAFSLGLSLGYSLHRDPDAETPLSLSLISSTRL